MKEPYEIFKKNVDMARAAVLLAQFKELKEALDMLDLGKPIRDFMRTRPRFIPGLDQVVDTFIDAFEKQVEPVIRSEIQKLYELGLPQTLVFVVSCLEAYLRDNYYLITRHRPGNLLNVKTIRKTYGKVIRGDIFAGNEELRKDLEEILEKRHVTIHNAGIIDEKACKNVERWNSSMIGNKIELSSEIVERHIHKIEEFAAIVHQISSRIITK